MRTQLHNLSELNLSDQLIDSKNLYQELINHQQVNHRWSQRTDKRLTRKLSTIVKELEVRSNWESPSAR